MNQSIQKCLELVLANNDFSLLTPYQNPTSWKPLTPNERELLAILLVKQGEMQLLSGDSKVLESFKLASKAAPFSPLVHFRQALVFASQNQNIRCLSSAKEALEKAIELDPAFIAALYGLSSVLSDIGAFYQDSSYFYKADETFIQADLLSQSNEHLRPENFLEEWGVCWQKIANLSGEASDYFKALEKFQAAKLRETGISSRYCNDYGNILVEIAFLLGREELFLEALEQYKISVTKFPDESDGWMNLGYTLQRLYEIHHLEEYFLEADESFERAIDINPDNSFCWLRWADLHALAGKRLKDIERIQSSLYRYEKATALDPDNATILSRFGEVQMLAATYTDNLDLLREAEINMSKAVQIEPEKSPFWYLCGMCLCELGRYFNDTQYFERAITKFQHSLVLDTGNAMAYHGTALAYYAIGEMGAGEENIEHALHNFNRSFELCEAQTPQFWNDWGVALMKLGELTNEKKYLEDAADLFEKAISYKFDEVPGKDIELEWLYNYGCVMDFLGDFHEEPVYYERAAQILAHVLQIDPDFSHAKYNLALALSHLGELNSDIDCFMRALDLFQSLIEQDNEDEYAWNDWGLTLTNLAVLTYEEPHPEFSKEYYGQAEGKFLQAIALGNVHAFYNLACLYALTESPTAAMHYLERANLSQALPPTDDIIHDEWLDNLRPYPPFRAFISELLGKQTKDKDH